MQLLRTAKYSKMISSLKLPVLRSFQYAYTLAGRYKPMSAEELAREPGETVVFKGEAPATVKNGRCEQVRQRYRIPRPAYEAVEDLIVTPEGASWKDGAIYERYSSQPPSVRMLLQGKPKPASQVENGIFVQSWYPLTYGDWTAEYLASLARLEKVDAPVFLPADLASKSYVRRDVKRLGLEVIGIEEPLLIRNAKVVRQQRVNRFWTKDHVDDYRRFLKVTPVEPKPGSILYLSRHGEVSEIADRSHPNLAIEAVVKARGGTVLRTRETGLEEYIASASIAETVLLDHGSAGYNMAFWSPRRVIEFASDHWWLAAFLMFADAMGVKDYTVLRSDNGSPDDVAAKTAAVLDLPIEY